MNRQSPEKGVTAMQAAEMLNCEYYNLDYYAWPQTFGSTAGPFGGIGGAAITTYTMEAWHEPGSGAAVIFCGSRIVKKAKQFKPARPEFK